MFKGHAMAFGDDTPKNRYTKKQMMHAVKQFGEGLRDLEITAIRYGAELLQKFDAQGTSAFDPCDLLRNCVVSIMMNLVFGEAPESEVIEMDREVVKHEVLFEPAGVYLLLDIFPALRFIMPSMRRVYRELVNNASNIQTMVRKLTSRRQKILREINPETKFFIDHFLILKEKQVVDQKLHKDMIIDDDDINVKGIELLAGGVVTTANLLYILVGILVNHPEVQDKAFEQITSVLGERPPTIPDKTCLPYLEALVLEILRYSTFGPFLVPHYTKKGGQINGYLIPENTIIFPNVWNLHHDTKYWENPWVFDPDRFIENGAVLPADHEMKQRVLMFGAGRRQCPGEIFAKNRLFILVSMMLQKYKFLPAEGFPKPKHDPHEYESHMGLKIKPYHICLEPRRGN